MGGNPNPLYLITERREKVLFMLSSGLNEGEIARRLSVDRSTISRDIKAIKKESQKKLESIAVNILPFEYDKCKICMDRLTEECWTIFHDKTGQWTNKNKLDALKLLKETNLTKLDVLFLGPLNLRAQQMEQKMKDLEEDERPKKSYMNLGLPAFNGQRDEDLR